MKLLWIVFMVGLLLSAFFLVSCSTQTDTLASTNADDLANPQQVADSVDQSIDQAILPETQEIEIGEMI